MDRFKLYRIENYLLRRLGKSESTARIIADIIGVYIGVKPCCLIAFTLDNASKIEIGKLEKLLRSFDMKCLHERHDDTLNLFVSKSDKKLSEIVLSFDELWKLNYESPEKPAIDAKIGKLLGYPETAISYYIHRDRGKSLSDAHKERIAHNRFFAHSAAHEDEEFAVFDAKIYRAMKKYTSRSAKIFESNKEKRWL